MSGSEPEVHRVRISDASDELLATLLWVSSTEYHVFAPDGALIGAIEQTRSGATGAWAARLDVMRRVADMHGDDPLMLAGQLAMDYQEQCGQRDGLSDRPETDTPTRPASPAPAGWPPRPDDLWADSYPRGGYRARKRGVWLAVHKVDGPTELINGHQRLPFDDVVCRYGSLTLLHREQQDGGVDHG